jgi:hypothetical protein
MRFHPVSISGLILLLCSSIIGLVSATAGTSGSSRQQKSSLEEARRIWEQAIAAKGGHERLYAVQNMAVSTEGDYLTSSGKRNKVSTKALFVFPNKVWRWIDYRPDVFGLTVEMYNFDKGISYTVTPADTSPRLRSIPSSETSMAHTYGLLSYLLETSWMKPTVIGLSTAKIGSRTVDVVHTTLRNNVEGGPSENRQIDFAFDRETHLPIRVIYFHMRDGKEVPDLAENLSDYTEVCGIKVPTKRVVDNSTTRITIQINVKYNEDIFVKPPSIKSGSGTEWFPKG